MNSWGYIDRGHDIAKEAGDVRFGFFGDSFTEGRQVSLEETFHRIIGTRLNDAGSEGNVECLAPAMTGYSTVQSCLEYMRRADSLAVDHAVYVFCEHDPGDNTPEIKRCSVIPYPYLAGEIPQVGDLPSTWPDSLVTRATTLTGAVIEAWRDAALSAGRRFTILCVPRSAAIDAPIGEQDSWAPWLFRLCRERGFDLVDPTAPLLERKKRGGDIFVDHFAPAGHGAAAEAFIEYYENRYGRSESVGP